MTRHIHALIVAGDPELEASLFHRLNRQGYSVECATGMPDALATATTQAYQLMVVDVELVDDKGYAWNAWLTDLKHQSPGTGVVALLDKHLPSSQKRLAADRIVSKPVTWNALSVALEQAYWSALIRANQPD